MHVGFLALSLLLSQGPVPVVPLPCAPGELSVVCQCKQGFAQACQTLAVQSLDKLRDILLAAEMAKAVQEKAKEGSTDVVDTGCGTGQDPNDDDQSKCTGQDHHIIDMAVWTALNEHDVLRGLYRYRDPRFVAQAKDLKAHCGYQDWHRKVDAEIAAWIKKFGQATAEQFEAYLREVYARPEIQVRFPNGF